MSILLVVALALTGCQLDVDSGSERAPVRADRASAWGGIERAGSPLPPAHGSQPDGHPAQAVDAGAQAQDVGKAAPAAGDVAPKPDAGPVQPDVSPAPDTSVAQPLRTDAPARAAGTDAAGVDAGVQTGSAGAAEGGAPPDDDDEVADLDPDEDEDPADGAPGDEPGPDDEAGAGEAAIAIDSAALAAGADAGSPDPGDVGAVEAAVDADASDAAVVAVELAPAEADSPEVTPVVVVGPPIPHDPEADASHGGKSSGVLNILLLLGLIIAAFLTTHFIVRFAGRKWFLASPGLPYLVIGVLVGPAVLDVISASNLSKLQPAVMVGIGSIGLLAGLRLNFRRMWGILEYEHLRSAGWIATLTALAVGLPTLLLMTWYVGGNWKQFSIVWFIAPPALLIVATALVSGTTPIQYTVERYKAKGWMSTFAIYVAEFSEVLGILVFSLVFAIANHGATFSGIELGLLGWLVIQVGVGILFGILFTWFIGGDDDKEKLLVALLGIIVFSSGVAYFLQLSPLLITFFVGLVLANFSGFAERIRIRLEAVEKPFFIVIFFFAGMQLVPSITWWSLLLVPAYALLRWGGKSLGGEVAFRTSARGEHVIRGVGSALISQGGLAVAMVLSYMQVVRSAPSVGSAMYQASMAPGFASGVHAVRNTSEVVPLDLVGNVIDPAVSITSIVCTVIIACIIINDTFSFISTRNLLINAGEIDPDVDVVPEDIYAHPELADVDLAPPEPVRSPRGKNDGVAP